MKLRIIPTSEGYFDALTNQYIYNYTDHLGNVRLSYSDTNKDGIIQPRQYLVSQCSGNWNPPFEFPICTDYWKPGEIVEVNNYYPFGLMHNYSAITTNPYQLKYNGKELQETGMYDYGARFYMPDIGRWGVVDPLAEKSRRFTPYHYGNNNPIRFIDPDGRLTMDNLSTYSRGSAVADFMSRNGFGEENLPLFYSDDAGMMIVNEALGENGQGGGGNIGSLMDAAGISIDGSIGSYEQSVGAVSLWQQLVNAGWKDPTNTKGKFGDIDKLLSDVPLLNELYEISKKPSFYECTNCPQGEEKGSAIFLNMSKIKSLLIQALVIGYEMNHTFLQLNKSSFMDAMRQRTQLSSRGFQFYKEYRAYSWEIKAGNSNIINAWDYSVNNYGPTAKKPQYTDTEINFIKDRKVILNNVYYNLYNNAIKKLNK